MMKLTSPKAYKIVKFLLANKNTTQLDLSRKTKVALGWTNEVVNFLYDRGIVSKSWGQIELVAPLQLLEIIAHERPVSKLVKDSFQLEVSSIAEGEELLKKVCKERKVKYGLTVFSGLKRFFEYYIAFPEIHAYVSDQQIRKFLPHGLGPITLTLLHPDQQDILNETKIIDDFSVCSPTQVVIDLFCSGIGRDGAMKFLEVIRDGKL
jgi:hypothetical protein